MRKLTLMMALAALILVNVTAVMAQTRTSTAPAYRGPDAPVVNPHTFKTADTYPASTTYNKQLHKLGRGVLNTLTGWLEIPKGIARVWRESDPVTGFVVGGIEGFGWGIGRTAVGIYDIVTFPIPVPADYQPIMEPEYLTPSLWGATVPGWAGDR